MLAQVLHEPAPIARRPLRLETRADPEPGPAEVRVRLAACACCRTDLHVVEGELPEARLPLVPGHQIVGTVAKAGPGVEGISVGARVGVPWLGGTDGTCIYCRAGSR